MGQGGNVWEWNEMLISGSYRGIRGGAYGTTWVTLTAANSLFTKDIPVDEDSMMGFRVASISFGVVPEPGSLGLLLLGLAGMAARRRRSAR
jgi:hypothetical protein